MRERRFQWKRRSRMFCRFDAEKTVKAAVSSIA